MAELPGLQQFLADYPGMRIQPGSQGGTTLEGEFRFCATYARQEVCADYEIRIEVPPHFPRVVPDVRELGKKIPRKAEFHVNPDATLCLGSPLRLRARLRGSPTLTGFAQECLVPYLYAVTKKIEGGGELIFGELAHGTPGIVSDYASMFGVTSAEQVVYALKLLGLKKRIANKKPCPCGCGVRLGRCRTRNRLNGLRACAPRSWFRTHAAYIRAQGFG